MWLFNTRIFCQCNTRIVLHKNAPGYVNEITLTSNGIPCSMYDNITDWTKMVVKDLVNGVHDRDGCRNSVDPRAISEISAISETRAGLKVVRYHNRN